MDGLVLLTGLKVRIRGLWIPGSRSAPAYRQLSCYYNIKELVNAGTHRIHFLYLPKINENRLKVDINFGVYLLIYCHFLLIGFRLKKMANKR